ncbi:MAG: Gfo/Idh/MocA family oxidoreductase [Chthoniobacterales bacterium]|nr:Gfo/Idh/MocA family oxidoreductase [Chthoniobacterales bacterium]
MPLPIALIGLGNQGREHLRTCLDHPELVVVCAVVDPHLDDGIALPEGCGRFSSIKDLPAGLAQGAIVATPPSLYRELLPDLIATGLHLLVEKPLGMNLGEAGDLLDLAARKQRVLIPAVQRRFHESYQSTQEQLEKMGPIHQAVLILELDKKPDAWRRVEKIGTLVDLGFHALDLARSLFGDLHIISSTLLDHTGRLCRDRTDAESHLLFHTESGTFLRISVKGGAPRKREVFHAYSETHRLVANREGWKLYRQDVLLEEHQNSREWKAAMGRQLDLFVDACRNQTPIRSEASGKFGLITMKLLEEIQTGAATI